MKFNISVMLKQPLPECYHWLRDERKEDVVRAFAVLAKNISGFSGCVSEELPQETVRSFLSQCQNSVDEWQYGIGGLTIHRGFYCPSPIRDIYIVNCSRGKKQLKITQKTEQKINYEYGFSDKQLVFVRKRYNENERFDEYECILYDGNTQYGYRISNKMILCGFSKSVYEDGLLMEYSVFQFDPGTYSVVDSEKERYEYCGRELRATTYWSLLYENLYRHYKYYFSHDEKGYLATYRVAEYKDGAEVPDCVLNPGIWTHKVRFKRKV